MSAQDDTKPGAGPAPTSEFQAIGNTVANFGSGDAQIEGEDEKVVQEIESLCMNCQENVSLLHLHAYPATSPSRTMG